MSARTIAVWGSPRSGKTTFCCRMGMALANAKNERTGQDRKVIVVCPDNEIPALALLFPRRDREDLPSMGRLLADPVIDRDKLLASLTAAEKGGSPADRLAYLGYAPCDHALRYPAPSPRACARLWQILAETADVLIADCPSDLRHPFAALAANRAQTVFRLLTGDLQSAVWEASRRERYAKREDDPADAVRELDWEKQIPCAGNPDGNRFRPTEDFRQAVTDVRFSLPFRKEWQTAMAEGNLPYLPVGTRERYFWGSVARMGEADDV